MQLVSIIERFRAHPDVNLVVLYGPEHGVRGNAQAGEFVASYRDEHFGGMEVFSLYGPALALKLGPSEQQQQKQQQSLEDIDATMREFDTQHTGKTVESGMVRLRILVVQRLI